MTMTAPVHHQGIPAHLPSLSLGRHREAGINKIIVVLPHLDNSFFSLRQDSFLILFPAGY